MQKELLYPLETRESNPPNSDFYIDVGQKLQTSYSGNELYYATLFQNRPVVVKFSVFNQVAKREWNGYVLAFENQVHTPEPIALVARDREPTIGFITTHLTGPLLSEVDSDERTFLLGKELNKLHAIALPGYGYLSEDGSFQFENMDAYLQYWFDKTIPFLQNQPKAAQLLHQLHDLCQSRLSRIKSSFLHHDVKKDNMIYNDDGNIYLTDFEWWQGGDPLDDLALYLYHSLRTNQGDARFSTLLQGYFEDSAHLTDKQRTALMFYLLLGGSRVVSFCSRVIPDKLPEAESDLEKSVQYIDSEKIFRI